MQIMLLVLLFATAFVPAAAVRHSSALASGASSLLQRCQSLKVRAAWAEDWSCETVAKFDDGHDRKIVNDLRKKDPADLTAREEAILTAANRVGAVGICSTSNGNAFLISLGGKPAVVTSAHIMIDDATGAFRCTNKQNKGAKYYPNISYYVADGDNDYALQTIDLLYPPLNLDGVEGKAIPTEDPDDVLIFYAQEDVSHDRMRDGRIRGAFRPPGERHDKGTATLIGVAPDVGNGMPMLYQEDCDYEADGNLVLHGCDTVAGSSGSFLGVMEGNELVPLAVHNYSKFGNETLPGSLGNFTPAMNGGVAASTFFKEREPLAVHLAYHIQWVLHETGCYSGKLDNAWGPGSRRALAAFAENVGMELPGREPSFALLDAVEAVSATEGECR